MRCLAITTRGSQCAKDAVAGDLLCLLHLRVAAEHDPGHHDEDHVDVAVTPIRILATHGKQDPLVATVFWASDRISEGTWEGDDNRMAHAVTTELAANGGALPDLDRLVLAGALPEWTLGYWRGAGYALDRVEPAYVDTDSGLIEVVRPITPAAGIPVVRPHAGVIG